MKDVTDSILAKNPIKEWPHKEKKNLAKLGDNIIGKVPTFENLKPLRTYINGLAKEVKECKFIVS